MAERSWSYPLSFEKDVEVWPVVDAFARRLGLEEYRIDPSDGRGAYNKGLRILELKRPREGEPDIPHFEVMYESPVNGEPTIEDMARYFEVSGRGALTVEQADAIRAELAEAA